MIEQWFKLLEVSKRIFFRGNCENWRLTRIEFQASRGLITTCNLWPFKIYHGLERHSLVISHHAPIPIRKINLQIQRQRYVCRNEKKPERQTSQTLRRGSFYLREPKSFNVEIGRSKTIYQLVKYILYTITNSLIHNNTAITEIWSEEQDQV